MVLIFNEFQRLFKMMNFPLEPYVRTQVDERLKNLGWDITGAGKNVFLEQPKTEAERLKLKGKRPDYVLYEKGKDTPLIIIETKKPGTNINLALEQGKEYARVLGAPIVFATDGVYYKSLHAQTLKPLLLNGEEVDELIRELLAIQFLQEGTHELNTIPKEVQVSRQELITIFDEANNALRVEGLRAGIERFSEFSNILFLKLLSEIDNLKDTPEFDRKFKWDFYKGKPADEILDYINGIVLPKIGSQYRDDNIFSPLQIKDGKVLKKMIDKLDPLILTDINSDIKGDAFEYFLKATSATGNDLGEYFTPRHIVKMMVKLVNPQIGEKIYDPFCGTGGLLIESFRHIYNTMPRNERTLNLLRKNTIFGNEITNTARITKMNMILAGDGHSNIQMRNSLANPVNDEFDIVVTNMPYSQTTEYGSLYDIPTKNGDSICVQHCIQAIQKTSENGRIAMVVPEGFLFRKDLQKTREYLMSKCKVQSVVSLPQGVFLPYTGVKTNILYLTNVKKRQKNSSTWFFEIKNDGFSLDSHRKKNDQENDVDKFLANRKIEGQSSSELMTVGFHAVEKKVITDNDYILIYNRYKSSFDFTSKWEFVSFSDENFFKIESGGTPDTKEDSYWGGNINWVTLVDLPSSNIVTEIKSTARLITKKGLDNSSAKLLPVNSVLISSRATIGRIAINKIPVATNQGFKNIIIKDFDKVLPEFVALMLTKLTPLMEQMASGATFKEISKTDFSKLKIPLPPMETQRKFVQAFYKASDAMNTKLKEIETLKTSISEKINSFWES
jgi:type I restriction enzyme M protein